MKHKFYLKTKLILYVGILILCIIIAQTALSYINLERAYTLTQTTITQSFDKTLQTGVQSVLITLDVLYEDYTNGKLSEEEAKEEAKAIVREARNGDENSYFWADAEDGTCVAHIDSALEDTKRYDEKDLNDNYYIRNIIEAGNSSEGGFTEYYFTKPGEEGAIKKRAFTMKFEPFGWYISTGNYYDDIEDALKEQETQELLALAIQTGASLLFTLAGIFVIYRIAGSITAPLTKVTERLKLLAEGDLSSPVPDIRTRDETGILADATQTTISTLHVIIGDISAQLSEMSSGNMTVTPQQQYKGDLLPIREALLKISQSLNKTLSVISQSAQQVNSGAEQLSISAASLSQGAAEQATSIEQISDSIRHVSDNVHLNSDNVDRATQFVDQAVQGIAESNNQMKNLLEAMKKINDSSDAIEKIIKIINDIAFQTNILALNASVEAARAGAAGKGFAIVADEVRNLASKVTDAASQTTALIQVSEEAVGNGSEIAENTASALQTVTQKTDSIKELMIEIDRASANQADKITQMAQWIDQISEVIQSNSANAEESAAASEELSGQAAMLQDETGKFILTR